MKVHGSCHCGFITFEAEADPEKVSLCHCTDCQAGSGSAFRTNVPVAGSSLKMLSGEPTMYVKTTAESGNPRVQAFCPKCGSPIYSTSPGSGVQPFYMLRVGILREREQLEPRRQNWFRSARPWLMSLGSVPKNEKGAA